MTAVLYARVPDGLKRSLAEYAEERGLKLTQAVVELLERALRGIAEEPSLAEAEAKLAEATAEGARRQGQLREAELRLEAVRDEEALRDRLTRTLAERARQPLGNCPRCRESIQGSDLLLAGRCPHCKRALSDALWSPALASVERDQYFALLGALGALVGLALEGRPKRTV